LWIDPYLVRELDAVDPYAPLFHEIAIRIELEEPGIAAAVIYENMPLRIGRNADPSPK
jgi:hypothetical protein